MDKGIVRANVDDMAEASSDLVASESAFAVGMSAAPPERRISARIPLDRPIRIGPPHGLPYAAVSARDLSAGGLFVDAERNVRVGARFSVEVTLENEDRVYVAEAEVVDNRCSARGAGFGCRFVSLSDEARRLLEAEVADRARVTLRSVSADHEPEGLDPLEMPTLSSLPPLTELESDLESRTEPKRGGVERTDAGRAAIDLGSTVSPYVFEDEGVVQAACSGARADPEASSTLSVRARTRWSRMKAWLRSFPMISGVLYGLGALAVFAVGLVVLLGPSPDAEPTAPQTRTTVTEDIHARLVDGAKPAGLRPPSVNERPEAIVNPLPEKEPLKARPAVEGALPEPARRDAARSPSRKVSSSPSGRERGRSVAPKGPLRSARPRQTQPGSATLGVEVGAGVRIKRQYVLRKPDRFVVDLVGVKETPDLPKGAGSIQSVRYGRHAGFSRIVVDARTPLVSGTARLRGARLELGLAFRH